MVVLAFRAAAKVATGGNGAPTLLSYLDAEDAGAYVETVMAKRENDNKTEFFKALKSDPVISEADQDTMWDKLRPFVRLGRFDPDVPNADKGYFESLAPWEQRWVDRKCFYTVVTVAVHRLNIPVVSSLSILTCWSDSEEGVKWYQYRCS